ncbi:MAG: metal ABC transporter substrate-binding protein [Atopobium sp.]|uniref:metal ABC transporter substrate-binding protein n=1 Tax=Atopobium sp. TaxID=1872650 RepID=UPI002A74B711|nr:metal ABC transporter substrate-binding protein [Atopobium sp.]MDY2788665.1 metal ABC transporter substrate-binding protein [Atopobium sp.]
MTHTHASSCDASAVPAARMLLRAALPAFTAIVVAFMTVLLLSGCSGAKPKTTNGAATSDKKPIVLTTFTVLQDMAKNVAGDHLDVQCITKPGAEIHDYEPTPDDIKRAQGASLVLENGLGLERWFEKFMADSTAKRANLSKGVEVMNIAEGEYAGKANPHAWMSPKNAEIYVDNIVAAFSDLDPAHAQDYKANGEKYKAQIRQVGEEMKAGLAGLPEGHRTLVSCEGAFSYLCRDAGLNEVYLWPVNAEDEGTPQQIANVIKQVKEKSVPTVFCETTVNPKAMQQVADETGAKFNSDDAHALYVDSLSEKDGVVPSYLELLRHDARVIVEGLAGQKK